MFYYALLTLFTYRLVVNFLEAFVDAGKTFRFYAFWLRRFLVRCLLLFTFLLASPVAFDHSMPLGSEVAV